MASWSGPRSAPPAAAGPLPGLPSAAAAPDVCAAGRLGEEAARDPGARVRGPSGVFTAEAARDDGWYSRGDDSAELCWKRPGWIASSDSPSASHIGG